MQNFTTEGGERYQWTERQVQAYRTARAAGIEERQATEAGHAALQSDNVRRIDQGVQLSAAEIYARRERAHAAAAGITACQTASQASNALLDAADIYAIRADVYRKAGLGGIQ